MSNDSTFLAEVSPDIYEVATMLPTYVAAGPFGLIEPGKYYIINVKSDISPLLGRKFSYIIININSHISINFIMPTHKISQYIWKKQDKAAKVLFQNKKNFNSDQN